MTLHHSLPLLEVRSQAQGLIEGYASVFGGIDCYSSFIVKGAYAVSLAQHHASGTNPAMLWAHDMSQPIGRWTSITEDARGLKVTGQINLQTEGGRRTFEHLRAGDVNGLSVGFNYSDDDTEFSNGITYFNRVDLQEISVVSVPADTSARISAVRSPIAKPTTIRGMEEALEQIGFSRREARSIAAKGFAGLGMPDESEELIAAIRAAAVSFERK
ncbi:HK97 family phage prohead protease [Diaphorobacter sp. HDW4A]|uniref:HK97 family phage prohead protease n=1 Tax=Diaphorobacter sp. HDW4A TaxID=2714924 RepID=UPI00140DC98F|nr:HK97 family phage prohead protease [Diaphorobacter sp. HDW4A]QIL78582.1 HK97 family phage prohead protease [Diaphorobacter sp. HDW4A]